MAARSGEHAFKSGEFHCAECDYKVYVKQGDPIPPCPNGHDEYDVRTKESDTQQELPRHPIERR